MAVKQITVRQARLRRGLTQEQLEAASGVSQAAISSIERGLVSDPSWSTVGDLAKALGLDPRELRFGEKVA